MTVLHIMEIPLLGKMLFISNHGSDWWSLWVIESVDIKLCIPNYERSYVTGITRRPIFSLCVMNEEQFQYSRPIILFSHLMHAEACQLTSLFCKCIDHTCGILLCLVRKHLILHVNYARSFLQKFLLMSRTRLYGKLYIALVITQAFLCTQNVLIAIVWHPS